MVLPVFAQSGEIILLTVMNDGMNSTGGTATLHLKITQGTGRVYIDTFPMTKMDTQISTRFAKQIACNILDEDCRRYDFHYTISAEAPIVGGPSAGAAITVLTAALLSGHEINNEIALTGTVNSGGYIGMVRGIPEKVDAASRNGIKKVLVPIGSNLNISESNIEVIEIADIEEALFYFTGEVPQKEAPIVKDIGYTDVMEKIATKLCNRTIMLSKIINTLELDENLTLIRDQANNLTRNAALAYNKSQHYAAASYCFGANIKYSYVQELKNNLSATELRYLYRDIEYNISRFSAEFFALEYKTITDLETRMITTNRLDEARSYLELVNFSDPQKPENIYYLIYARERLYSASCWSLFHGSLNNQIKFNSEILRESCIRKISEAEERIEYINLYFPLRFGARDDIREAYGHLKSTEYESCLYKASIAKASANAIISVIGVNSSNVSDLVERKIDIAGKFISKQIEKGIFPVIGYSYYEYSKSLLNTDPQSALIYAEYALELGNLDIYFPKDKFFIYLDNRSIMIYLFGLVLGFVLYPALQKIFRKREIDKLKKKYYGNHQ